MFLKVRSALLLAVFVTLPAAVRAQTRTPTPAQTQTFQPVRVAIINAQKAVADTQEIKKDQATLEAKYHPRQQAIENLQRDLQNIQQQLNTPNLPPARESQLRMDGTDKQKQLQRMNEDLQTDVNNDRQDILGRAGRQMTEVVKKIAEAQGIDVVIDITNTIYFKPALDITAEATAAYDKAYPAP